MKKPTIIADKPDPAGFDKKLQVIIVGVEYRLSEVKDRLYTANTFS
jgi:hypothetical protein